MQVTKILVLVLAAQQVLSSQQQQVAADRDITIKPVKKLVAVIVGSAKHPISSGVRSLDYAEADAEELRAAFASLGYEVHVLLNEAASKTLVLRLLQQFEKNQPERFVFAYIGHGFSRNSMNYLVTHGTTLWTLQDALALKDVEKGLIAVGARQTISFIDACRNDPMVEGVRAAPWQNFTPELERRISRSTGMKIMFSSKAGEISYESKRLGQGVFSYFLAKALKGESMPGGAVLSFRSVFDQVSREVTAYVGANGEHQIPAESGEASGDLLIGTVPIKATMAQTAPAPASQRSGETPDTGKDIKAKPCDPIVPEVCAGTVWVSFPQRDKFCLLRSGSDFVLLLKGDCKGEIVAKLRRRDGGFEGRTTLGACPTGVVARLRFESPKDAVFEVRSQAPVSSGGKFRSRLPVILCPVETGDSSTMKFDVYQLTLDDVVNGGAQR